MDHFYIDYTPRFFNEIHADTIQNNAPKTKKDSIQIAKRRRRIENKQSQVFDFILFKIQRFG
jgi:hypothetical protein